MPNLREVVKYDALHELRVTYPNSDRYLGLTIGIRNASSEAAKAAVRKQENDRRLKSRNKQRKQTAETAEQDELELTASTMAWFKWENDEPSDESKKAMSEARHAGKSQEEIAALDDSTPAEWNGEQPSLTMEICVEMLDQASFIYAQVKGASIDVENFMKTGSKG